MNVESKWMLDGKKYRVRMGHEQKMCIRYVCMRTTLDPTRTQAFIILFLLLMIFFVSVLPIWIDWRDFTWRENWRLIQLLRCLVDSLEGIVIIITYFRNISQKWVSGSKVIAELPGCLQCLWWRLKFPDCLVVYLHSHVYWFGNDFAAGFLPIEFTGCFRLWCSNKWPVFLYRLPQISQRNGCDSAVFSHNSILRDLKKK